MRRTRQVGLLLALVCTALACTGRDAPPTAVSPKASATSPSASAPGTTTTAPPPPAGACPSDHREPPADRPVVTLHFRLDADRRRVAGRERIVFTPDRPIDEVVFRLWPNSPQTALDGAAMTVSTVRVDGQAVRPRIERAGAPEGAVGTLLSVPLPRRLEAGQAVTAELAFGVRLPGAIADRLGHSPQTAWWASAHPMLAWERGHGWNVETAPKTPGEGQASEVFRLHRLTVDAPAGDEVLATGERVSTAKGKPGRSIHTFRARSARDVAVVSGELTVERTTAGGIPIIVGRSADGVGPGGSTDIARVVELAKASVEDMRRRYGPFPYEQLSLALIPGVTGGIEYPGLILLGGQQNHIIVPHEVAHEWFYGLVGNNQARDPWLDEAFATYAEALFNESTQYIGAHEDPAALDRVGAPMSFWDSQPSADYQDNVYGQGAGALLSARRLVGAARWDAAIKCYVAAHAHRIARPEHLRAAIADFPAAIRELEEAGAL